MLAAFQDISIIVPVGPDEDLHCAMVSEVKRCVPLAEVIVKSEGSRAKSMNAGAEVASRRYLWFLHADSKVSVEGLHALVLAIRARPLALHYFDLAFIDDGPASMWLNSLGAWGRSHLLGVPFGDQGLCIRKELFEAIGNYPEDVKYGEDHVFVWRARQYGVQLNCVGSKLYTSARKYAKHGWWRLTLLYQFLWMKQALPEWAKLLSHQNTRV